MTKAAKRNARFRRMTKAEQRVAIARDALAWIEAGALVPETGDYLRPLSHDRFSDILSLGPAEAQLRDVRFGACRCCAVGAILAAKAVRFDNVRLRDLNDWNLDALKDHFSETQLTLIEQAFEGTDTGVFGDLGDRDERATEFARRHTSDSGRLRAILENIIANNGTFRPEASP